MTHPPPAVVVGAAREHDAVAGAPQRDHREHSEEEPHDHPRWEHAGRAAIKRRYEQLKLALTERTAPSLS